MSTDAAPAPSPDKTRKPTPAPPAPVKYTRRKGLIGLGVALFALGGGGAYLLAQQASDAVSVVALAADVPRGQVIEASDLTTASTNPDPALDPVAADHLDDLVGQHAAVDLAAGSILTTGAVTSTPLPPAGQTIVGVSVTPPQMPTTPIDPGDRIRVFDTPAPGDPPPDRTPDAIEATVVNVSGMTDTGHIVVNVLVDEDVAGDLIARVATQRVGIAVDSIEGGGDEE